MSLPLDGVTVVSLEQAVAAPFASRQLADLGARVLKIERTDGGDFARYYDEVVHGMATYFVWLNRGKESVALDLKTETGRAALEGLLAHADVFIQNLAPGAAERLGLAAEQIVARHPRIVACDMSGFGRGGPLDDRRAYDLVVQAETGSISITGTEESRAKPGIAVADIGAAMYTANAVLAGLLQRARTGLGSALAVSMFDATAEWMSYSAYLTRYTGSEHVPYGIGHHAIVPYGAFRTADGDTVVVAVQNEREWARFAEHVLRDAALADDPRMATASARVENRAVINELCTAAIARLSLAEAFEVLGRAGIAHGRLNTASDLLEHPQLLARDRWREVASPVGTLPALLPPVVSSTWVAAMGPIPALGEHTAAVLAEFGIDPAPAAS